MKILLVSDTHGQLKGLREAVKKEKPFDYLIHMGDVEDQEREIEGLAGCSCTFVRGNNDYNPTLPDRALLTFAGMKIYAAHGHRLGVHYGYERLIREAKKEGARIALFGHTHRPVIEDGDPKLLIMNPGSLTYPRQEGRQPSYIVLTLSEGQEPEGRICYLKRNG